MGNLSHYTLGILLAGLSSCSLVVPDPCEWEEVGSFDSGELCLVARGDNSARTALEPSCGEWKECLPIPKHTTYYLGQNATEGAGFVQLEFADCTKLDMVCAND